MPKHYLLYGSERYALAILRPVQEAIRARGDEAAWFFDGPGAEDLVAGERLLTVDEVRAWRPIACITSSNHLPHFFPGVKVETFHGFDAGKPRHIYIRGFFDLYCTTGPRDTAQFQALADELGHFAVAETGWPKIDPFRTADPPGDRAHLKKLPIQRVFGALFAYARYRYLSLENWSKKQHIAILIGSCIRGGRYEQQSSRATV